MIKSSSQTLIAKLSESEKSVFEALLTKMAQSGGNLTDLSETDQAKLEQLVTKHNLPAVKVPSEKEADVALTAAQTSTDKIDFTYAPDALRPMETAFGVFLIDTINESLCQGGSSTTDAIRYAYLNRWMPETLKNRDTCESLYYQYSDDIDLANSAIKDHISSQVNNDTIVAVGLAWFTNLYRCYQLIEAEGDL